MEKVSLLGCPDYEPGRLDAVVERHFAALEAAGPLIRPGDRVAVKPNLVMARAPEEATTTHPAFVAAVLRAVKRRGGEPVIAESPGGPYTRFNLRAVYSATGIEAAARAENVPLNYDLGSAERPAEGAEYCRSFPVIRPVLQADVVISVAKLKTHCMTGYSGAVKNLFGVVPGLTKPEFHYRFPEKAAFGGMLVDLCEAVRPAISLLDGIVGMEGNGPTGGHPRPMGLTAASRNPHALDLLASRLIGMTPEEVPTLRDAIARKLCPADVGGLAVAGDRAERFLCDFEKPESQTNDFLRNARVPAFIRRPLTRMLTPRPSIRRSACMGCGKCAESCPRHTIAIQAHKAVIDYSRCIRCFCCHEMCPHRAIDIRRFRLFGL